LFIPAIGMTMEAIGLLNVINTFNSSANIERKFYNQRIVRENVHIMPEKMVASVAKNN
jgi:hypothetical protein